MVLQYVNGNRGVPTLLRSSSQGSPAKEQIRHVASNGITGSGRRLPYSERIQMAFGRHDIGGIAAHTDGRAAESAQALGAHAYATGAQHVAFAGYPDLRTAAHEAAHVIQQRAGARPSAGMSQVGDRLERNAEAAAERVVAGQSAEAVLDQEAPERSGSRLGGDPMRPGQVDSSYLEPVVQCLLSATGANELNRLTGGHDATVTEIMNFVTAYRLKVAQFDQASNHPQLFELFREALELLLKIRSRTSKILAHPWLYGWWHGTGTSQEKADAAFELRRLVVLDIRDGLAYHRDEVERTLSRDWQDQAVNQVADAIGLRDVAKFVVGGFLGGEGHREVGETPKRLE